MYIRIDLDTKYHIEIHYVKSWVRWTTKYYTLWKRGILIKYGKVAVKVTPKTIFIPLGRWVKRYGI